MTQEDRLDRKNGAREIFADVLADEPEIPETLEGMADAINQEHRACERAFTSSLEHAIRAGKLLVYAKTTAVEHGQWQTWLKENFEGSVRVAQMYMRVFRGWDKLEKTKRVSHLGLRGALNELAESPELRSPEDTLKMALTEETRYLHEAVRAEVGGAGLTKAPIAKPKTTVVAVGGVSSTTNEKQTDDGVDTFPATLTNEERELYDRLTNDEIIVVNMHEDGPHKNLVPWLKATQQLAKVDRTTDWGNPFKIPGDGDRDTVVHNFEHHYIPYKPSLHARLDELRGRALGCWCSPERCHADVLLRLAEEAGRG